MTGWLAKATQVLRRHEPPEPQAFNVPCGGCGNRVAGDRLSDFQLVSCNRCGTRVFILPWDVYPKPKVKAKKNPPKTAGKAVEEGRSAVQVPSASHPPPRPTLLESLRERAVRFPSAASTASKTVFTPIRLIALAIVAVVVGTGYFVWNSRANENARISLPVHVANGEAALHDGNLRLAAEEFQKAAAAVHRLGRDDAEARRICQKSREVTAIVGLSPVSLYEICEEAQRALHDDKSLEAQRKWNDAFLQLHRGTWIVIEGTLRTLPGPDGVLQPAIRYPFPIDDAPVFIDGRLPALSGLEEHEAPRKIILAGQLASLKKEGTKTPVWMVGLNERSAFLWADRETYQVLVPGDDPATGEETRRILNEQAAAIGIAP
jgi:hypothetical protein